MTVQIAAFVLTIRTGNPCFQDRYRPFRDAKRGLSLVKTSSTLIRTF